MVMMKTQSVNAWHNASRTGFTVTVGAMYLGSETKLRENCGFLTIKLPHAYYKFNSAI